MQSEATHNPGAEPRRNDITTCLNCRAAMPREMRFCRACGRRLGEGLAEYVETMRFDSSPRAAAAASQQATASPETHAQRKTTIGSHAKNFGARAADDVVHGALKGVEELFKNLENHFKQNQVKLSAQTSRLSSFGCGGNAFRFNRPKNETSVGNKKRGAHRPTRIGLWIMLALLFTVFVNLTSSNSNRRNRESRTATAAQAREATATAIRQKVIALREAAIKAREEILADTNNASSISSRNGSLGLNDSDFARVAVPGTNLYGVRLGETERNSPAYLSGLREKDIVMEFDGAPVRSVEEFAAHIKRATPGRMVMAVVMRGAERLEIPVLVGQDD